jgi:hypothetical protein
MVKTTKAFTLIIAILLTSTSVLSQKYTRKLSYFVNTTLELKNNNKYVLITKACLGNDTVSGEYELKNDTLILNHGSPKSTVRLISYNIEYGVNNVNQLVFKDQDSKALFGWFISIPKASYYKQENIKENFISLDGTIDFINADFTHFSLSSQAGQQIYLPLPEFDENKKVRITYNLRITGDPSLEETRYFIKKRSLYYIDYNYEVSKSRYWKKIGL